MNNKKEFSKRILATTKVLFISQLIAGMVCAFIDKDTTFFCYSIPATAGAYGAAICFYLNKAKMENVFKGVESLIIQKSNLKQYLPDDVYDDFCNQLGGLEVSLNTKIESTISDAIDSNIEIQNL